MTDQIVLIVAFLLFLVVGFWRRRGGQATELRRFTLSEGRSNWFAIAAGISMTFVGGAATLNMSSLGYQFAWAALIDPFAVLGGLLITLFFVQSYRDGTGLTIADMLADTDGWLAIFTGVLTLVVYILLTAAQFVALGKLITPYFPQIPIVPLIAIASSLVFAYVFLGGYYSVTKTDILQYACILILLVLPISFVAIGGGNASPGKVDPGFQPMPLDLFILLGFSLLFVPVSQDVSIRSKAAATPRAAIIGFLVGGLSYFLFVGACIYAGLNLAASGVTLEDPEVALPRFFAIEYPTFGIVAIVAVMAAIISTLDSWSLSAIAGCANDLVSKIGPLRRASQSQQLLASGIIVYVLASAIALYFTEILGLILTGLLLYVSVLFPIAIGRHIHVRSRVLLWTGLLTVAFIIFVEIVALPIFPKAIIYPSSHLGLVLLCRLFPQLTVGAKRCSSS